MWLYTVQGYYSIVHKPPCKKDELLVRVRCRDDIEKLQKLLGEKYKFNGKGIERFVKPECGNKVMHYLGHEGFFRNTVPYPEAKARNSAEFWGHDTEFCCNILRWRRCHEVTEVDKKRSR